jgi:hypothetical protein
VKKPVTIINVKVGSAKKKNTSKSPKVELVPNSDESKDESKLD